jgi:hypothetical protein
LEIEPVTSADSRPRHFRTARRVQRSSLFISWCHWLSCKGLHGITFGHEFIPFQLFFIRSLITPTKKKHVIVDLNLYWLARKMASWAWHIFLIKAAKDWRTKLSQARFTQCLGYAH